MVTVDINRSADLGVLRLAHNGQFRGDRDLLSDDHPVRTAVAAGGHAASAAQAGVLVSVHRAHDGRAQCTGEGLDHTASAGVQRLYCGGGVDRGHLCYVPAGLATT